MLELILAGLIGGLVALYAPALYKRMRREIYFRRRSEFKW